MRTKFFAGLMIVAMLGIWLAGAQPTGVRGVTSYTGQAANGGASNSANYVTAPGTNVYFVTCEEYEKIALASTVKGTDAGTSTVRFDAYRSLDSTTYETTPFFQQHVALNGTTPVPTVTELNVQGAAVLKIHVANTNATVAVTNFDFRARFKAPKLSTFPTSR